MCRAWCLGQEMFCRGRRHSLCRVTVVLLSLHWVLCKSHFCRAVRMCQDTPGSPGLPWLGSAVWCCLQKTIAVNSQNRGLLFPFSKHQKDLEHLPVVTLLALPCSSPLHSSTDVPGEELCVLPPVLFHIMEHIPAICCEVLGLICVHKQPGLGWGRSWAEPRCPGCCTLPRP